MKLPESQLTQILNK